MTQPYQLSQSHNHFNLAYFDRVMVAKASIVLGPKSPQNKETVTTRLSIMSPTNESLTYATQINIALQTRTKLITMLNQHLADTLDLKTQVKQAHWNVKGMNFIALHELFDTFSTTLENYVDMVAERVTALGGTAMGTARIVANSSTLPEYDFTAVEGKSHLEALAHRYGAYAAKTRDNIEQSAELGDADTSDLFTEISRQIDKDLWFIEAHLQA